MAIAAFLIVHSKDESKETATAVIQFLYANKDRIFTWTQHDSTLQAEEKIRFHIANLLASQTNIDRFNF